MPHGVRDLRHLTHLCEGPRATDAVTLEFIGFTARESEVMDNGGDHNEKHKPLLFLCDSKFYNLYCIMSNQLFLMVVGQGCQSCLELNLQPACTMAESASPRSSIVTTLVGACIQGGQICIITDLHGVLLPMWVLLPIM